jgi:hypothetical protein
MKDYVTFSTALVALGGAIVSGITQFFHCRRDKRADKIADARQDKAERRLDDLESG